MRLQHGIKYAVQSLVRYTFIFLILISLVACSKKTKVKPDGGQDSGGGNATQSSMSEVEINYKLAEKNAEFVYGVFFGPSFRAKIIGEKRKELFDKVLDKMLSLPGVTPQNTDFLEQPVTPELNRLSQYTNLNIALSILLKSSKIDLNRSSACASVDKEHAFASIRDLKLNSSICMSLYQFQYIPSYSLYREMLGIMLHEYTHALGFGEQDAQEMQALFINNFEVIEEMYLPLMTGGRRTITETELERLRGLPRTFNYYTNLKRKLTEQNKLIQICSGVLEAKLLVNQIGDQRSQYLEKFKGSLLVNKILKEDEIYKLKEELDISQLRTAVAIQKIYNDCDSQSLKLNSRFTSKLNNLNDQILDFIQLIEKVDSRVSWVE